MYISNTDSTGRFGLTPIEKADLSSKERFALAKRGLALPDGSYPIRNKSDLHNAIQAFGRASDKDATKRFIIKRAKELDALSVLPEDWTEEMSKAKKGTPQYEEWLRKYKARKSGEPKETKEPSKTKAEDKPTPTKVSRDTLLNHPPRYINDKETWTKVVNKLTEDGGKEATYGAAIKYYKNKKAKQNLEHAIEHYSQAMAQHENFSAHGKMVEGDNIIGGDLPDANKAFHLDELMEYFKDLRLNKAKKGTPEYDEWLRKYRAKKGVKIEDSSKPAAKSKKADAAKIELLKKQLARNFAEKHQLI